MTCAAFRFDQPPADPGPAENEAGGGETPDNESLFAVFADEIDAWARHALAANGFGDLP